MPQLPLSNGRFTPPVAVFLPQVWWFLAPGAAVTSRAALGMAQAPPKGDGGESQTLFLCGG